MKKIVIGFLGGGNIGGCVYRLIDDMHDDLMTRCGIDVQVKKVLVKDLESFIPNGIPVEKLVFDRKELMADPEITIIAEFMGGAHPAADWMLEALKAGKSVVTANKVALATNWHLLQAAAEENHVGLYFEASVGGAVPIIATLMNSLQANRIEKLMCIINGTTNYILSRMYKNNEDYALVLQDAQKLGLAEPDPTFDVEGMDAAFKLSIMASLAFHGRVTYEKVYREGITGVTATDIAYGRDMGYVLKLLAIAKRNGQEVEVRVHPTFVPADHPLAKVDGSLNACYIYGHSCEDMMLQGFGAGSPTASAVVSDIIQAATCAVHTYPNFKNTAEADPSLNFTDNWTSKYYLRLSALDEPGVLAKVAAAFADKGISVATLRQQPDACDEKGRVTMIVITHAASEQAVRAVVDGLDAAICRPESMIRVEA